jgi:hypothetical protein
MRAAQHVQIVVQVEPEIICRKGEERRQNGEEQNSNPSEDMAHVVSHALGDLDDSARKTAILPTRSASGFWLDYRSYLSGAISRNAAVLGAKFAVGSTVMRSLQCGASSTALPRR